MKTMMKILLLVCFLVVMPESRATTTPTLDIPDEYTLSIEQLASYINAHCANDKEKLEAIHTWITHKMSYNLYPTFSSRNEKPDEDKEVQETLRTRKGVCRQFALIFTRVAEEMGITAFIVMGYNKNSEGGIMPNTHDWCAVKLESGWYLYDPTFDMGYEQNGTFVSDPKMNYCHVTPRQFIQDHMPYDPVWQLLEHPYRYEEFDKGTFRMSQHATTCHYNDSILTEMNQPHIKQLTSSLQRVLQNGVSNELVEYYIAWAKSNISVYRKQEVYTIYEAATKMQNKGYELCKDFIRYGKADFKPKKKKKQVRQMLLDAKTCGNKAIQLINSIESVPQEYVDAIEHLKEYTEELIDATDTYSDFLEKYYKASSSKRKMMLKQLH